MQQDGFFKSSELFSIAPEPTIPLCGACGLFQGCESPKMPPSGKGQRKILIIGEAPDENEDHNDIQLCGKTGQHLEKTLRKFEIDMRRDCILTNAIICRPPGNKTPDDKQIGYCRPNLTNTIREYAPEIIIPIGAVAVESLLGSIWKEKVGGIGPWVGWQIPCQKPNAWICPTYHPSDCVRGLDKEQPDKVPQIWFERHLKAAVELEGRPWTEPPNYASQIEPIYNSREAALAIWDFLDAGDPIAFDYETNCKKPETYGAAIISCSVSNGKWTIAFPWQGEAIDAMLELIRSPCLKIASNMSFEQRWTMQLFKIEVCNWWWDTMLSAHHLDNRSGITSIKFQAFVLFGQTTYNQHIEEFLGAKSGMKINQILSEIDIQDLLTYNGLDSLLEWKVAHHQMSQLTEIEK